MLKQILKLSRIAVIAIGLFTIASCSPNAQNEEATDETVAEEAPAEEEAKEEAPKPKASPRMQAEGEAGGATVKVDWGSPAVKGREIWGGLEDYGKVWRAGANETTNIEFSTDVMINGTKVAAGKYGFFIIPNDGADWVAIINTDWSREEHEIWGADKYTEEHDVVRVNVTPEWSEEVTESLEYKVEDGAIKFAWEKASFSIPVEAAN
ncbi:MAG: DUF2911 domain-containing protein [Cyclobacteriaceae bacterium]|nr:DUF2911 domain-containing protein [Cyclobacteriaceae bacterium]